MKNFVAASLLMAAGFAASAQNVRVHPITPKSTDAPELTHLFNKTFGAYGPFFWKDASFSGFKGTFFYLGGDSTDIQRDINQNIIITGEDGNGNATLDVKEIQSIRMEAENQRDHSIHESVFLQRMKDSWRITKTITAHDPPSYDARRRDPTAQGETQQQSLTWDYPMETPMEELCENMVGLLYPAPKKTGMKGLLKL